MSDWAVTGALVGCGLALGLSAAALGFLERIPAPVGTTAVSVALLLMMSAGYFSPLAQLTGG